MRPDDERAAESSRDVTEGNYKTCLKEHAEIGVLVVHAPGQPTSFGFDDLPPKQDSRLVIVLSREANAHLGPALTMSLRYSGAMRFLSGPFVFMNIDC